METGPAAFAWSDSARAGADTSRAPRKVLPFPDVTEPAPRLRIVGVRGEPLPQDHLGLAEEPARTQQRGWRNANRDRYSSSIFPFGNDVLEDSPHSSPRRKPEPRGKMSSGFRLSPE